MPGLGAVSLEEPGVWWPLAGCGLGEEPRLQADGWASALGRGAKGIMDTLNFRFCLKLIFFFKGASR